MFRFCTEKQDKNTEEENHCLKCAHTGLLLTEEMLLAIIAKRTHSRHLELQALL